MGSLRGRGNVFPFSPRGSEIRARANKSMAQQQAQQGVGPQAPSGFNNTEHKCNTRPRRPKKPTCGQRTLIGFVDGKYSHHRHRCKSYACGVCGPKKIRQVRKRIVHLAIGCGLQRFLTLTLDPKKLPPGLDLTGKIAFLYDCWRKMRVYFARHLSHPLVFISVVELQGNGNPHLHMLIGSYVRKEWINHAWQAVGGGSSTRIEYADIHRVAAYLANYLTDESLCDLPSGTRRFSASRGLVLFDRSKSGDSWILVRGPIPFWRKLSDGITGEKHATDGDAPDSLESFTAERVNQTLMDRLRFGGPRLAIEVSPLRANVPRHRR
jgi:hypothetical protein